LLGMSEPTKPEDARTRGGPPPGMPGLPDIDVREWGGKREGERQVLDRRTFFQLMAFDVEQGQTRAGLEALASMLSEQRIASVLYQEASAPMTIALLTWSENPAHFVEKVLPIVDRPELVQRREYTMLGRTYSLGHEPDLEHALLRRPVEYCLHAGWDWHVWYPLRRNGAFERLDKHEQNMILKEHASIGMAYGRADLAHDVRLACHGLDANDNEFVVGLIGKDLYPLSHVVQAMRHTKQTSEFISQMGPFFVGRVVARCAG
ncbi:MAG: chlorite dismutase family protein, partial [Deltaproteobacteria bacterium]